MKDLAIGIIGIIVLIALADYSCEQDKKRTMRRVEESRMRYKPNEMQSEFIASLDKNQKVYFLSCMTCEYCDDYSNTFAKCYKSLSEIKIEK